MGIDFRMPNIAGTDREQLAQIRSYLYQFIPQLQWALNTLDNSYSSIAQQAITPKPKSLEQPTAAAKPDDPEATFNSIKAIIIKSADIVNAYYEDMNKRFESAYVAQSEFGTFAQKTAQDIKANADGIEQVFTNVQLIDTTVSNIDTNVKTIDTTVKTMDTTVRTIDTKVTTIDTDLKTVSGEVQNIDTTLKTVESSVGNLDTNIKSVEDNVGKLDTTLKTVEENVGAIDTNLKTVEQNVGEIDTNLKTVGENVNAIDSNLKTVEQNVGDIDNNLKTVEGNVGQLETNLQDTKSGIGSNLESLSSEVGQIDTALQEVKTGIDTNVKELTEDIGDLDSSLKDMKDEVDSELQDVKDELESIIYTLIEVNASIKTGLLYYDDNGIPIYGLEIGQRNTVDGVEVFNKFARFTSDRLSFYDRNGTEVAYISDYKLHITNAEIEGTLKLGAFLVDTSKGFRLKWVGRG